MKRYIYIIFAYSLAILQIAFMVLVLAAGAGLSPRSPLSSPSETGLLVPKAVEPQVQNTKIHQSMPKVVPDENLTAKKQTPTESTSTSIEPPMPWSEALASKGRSFDEVCYEDFDTTESIITEQELSKWFEPVRDYPSKMIELTRGNRRGVEFEGLTEFKSPWLEDVAHKFSFVGKQAFQLHYFHGNSGVTIEYNRDKKERWVAYNTDRAAGKSTPSRRSLILSDGGLETLGNLQHGPTVMIYLHDRELVVTRGDVVLIRVPISEKPQEVFFQGNATFRGLEIVRLENLPSRGDKSPFDDATLISSQTTNSSSMDSARLRNIYRTIAWDEYWKGEHRPYSLLREVILRSGKVSELSDLLNNSRLFRAEVLQLFYHKKWQELHRLYRQFKFFELDRSMNQSVTDLVDWAGAKIALNLPTSKGIQASILKESQQSPWRAEIDAEAYNAMSEIEVALKNRSYQDISRLLSSIDRQMLAQIVPETEDPERFISARRFIETKVISDKNVLSSIQGRIGTLSRLRMSRAIAENRADDVELAAFCFPGTVASAEGYLWLGDRATASGEFNQAIEYYQKIDSSRNDLSETRLARIRLAAAMLGKETYRKTDKPQHYGELLLDSEQFEAEISRVLKSQKQAGPNVRSNRTAKSELQIFSFPEKYYVEKFPEPSSSSAENSISSSGSFRIIQQAKSEELKSREKINLRHYYSCNQVVTYDLKGGSLRWRRKLPQQTDSERLCFFRDDSLLEYQNKIYTKGNIAPGKKLFCLDSFSGNILWDVKVKSGELFVADPVIVDGKILIAIATKHSSGDSLLRLAKYDAEIGRRESIHDLIRLNQSWQPSSCMMIANDNKLLLSLPGVLACCDLQLNLRWIRRQSIIPKSEKIHESRQRPVSFSFTEQEIILAHQASETIESIDLDSGELIWRQVVPEISTLAAEIENQLYVLTVGGIQAREKTTGKLQWHREIHGLQEVFLSNHQESIYCWQNDEHLNEPSICVPSINELSRLTGEVINQRAIPELESRTPYQGPFIIDNQTLWTFHPSKENNKLQRLIRISPELNSAVSN